MAIHKQFRLYRLRYTGTGIENPIFDLADWISSNVISSAYIDNVTCKITNTVLQNVEYKIKQNNNVCSTLLASGQTINFDVHYFSTVFYCDVGAQLDVIIKIVAKQFST